MIVKNNTKKSVLSEHIIEAKTVRQKVIGLAFCSTPFALCFTTHFGIHTLGMRFPIDVIILDSHNQVVRIKTNLQPNRIFVWNPKYSKVLELPPGTIQKTNTHVGDYLVF